LFIEYLKTVRSETAIISLCCCNYFINTMAENIEAEMELKTASTLNIPIEANKSLPGYNFN
jgi:hypothetical protein